MHISSSARQPRPFNLMRWFSLAAFASIALVSATAAWFFSHFLAERMIRQEAEVTAGFVRSIVATENAYAYFDGSSAPATEQLQNFLDHITRMPGVLRTNVYSAERKVVWSSDPALIGQRFDRNDELEEALRADLVVHSGIIDPAHLPKSEHQHLGSASRRFVESYIPIFDVHDRRVVGVVELYVVPEELFEALMALEAELGRSRVLESRWGPRPIDIDLLLFGDAIRSTPRLTLPHPRIWLRPFVLLPLSEVAPEVVSREKIEGLSFSSSETVLV